MVEVLDVILRIVTSEYFVTMVVAPGVAFLVDRALHVNRAFRTKVVTLMLLVQKQFPDWDGEQKKDRVIQLLKSNTWIAKFVPESLLHTIIDTVVKEIKDELNAGN
jgi:hypothetical protein